VANGDAVEDRGFRRIARLFDRTFLEFGRLGSWAARDVPDTGVVDVEPEAVSCWNPSAWSDVSDVSTVEAPFVSETEGWLPLLRGSRAAMAVKQNGRLVISIGRSYFDMLQSMRPRVQAWAGPVVRHLIGNRGRSR
jgi:hypothetical protein